MPRDPDPTPSPRLPTFWNPYGMRFRTVMPVTWNPDPIPSPVLPVSRPPDSVRMGRRSVNFHPGFGWSDMDGTGRTTPKKDSHPADDNQQKEDD